MRVVEKEELRARSEELSVLSRWAQRRHAELVQRQQEIAQRRAEVRRLRQRLRTTSADRLVPYRERSRAAAALLEAATRAADIPMIELWIDYFSLGGTRSLGDFRATMEGRLPVDSHNHDLVALALNERLIDRGFQPFLAYWDGSRAIPRSTT